jgi:predicted nucleic acid-binding protein
MRLVVADTGPLNYLVLIGAIDLLPKLFETVLVPQAVCDELCHRVAPAAVRAAGRCYSKKRRISAITRSAESAASCG